MGRARTGAAGPGSLTGSPPCASGLFVAFEGGEARASRPRHGRSPTRCSQPGHEVVLRTREPGGTPAAEADPRDAAVLDPRVRRPRPTRRGAALRRRPRAARRHGDPPRARPRGRRDHRPLHRLLGRLPGRRPRTRRSTRSASITRGRPRGWCPTSPCCSTSTPGPAWREDQLGAGPARGRAGAFHASGSHGVPRPRRRLTPSATSCSPRTATDARSRPRSPTGSNCCSPSEPSDDRRRHRPRRPGPRGRAVAAHRASRR